MQFRFGAKARRWLVRWFFFFGQKINKGVVSTRTTCGPWFSSVTVGCGIFGLGWVVWGDRKERGKGSGCLGDVAGAGAGQLVGVNEEAPVGVARVDGEHPVVDVLLGALRLVAGSQQPAGAVGGQAGLQ